MAAIKSYTDLQQSKKLAEILPIESADMWLREVSYGFYKLETEIPRGWYDVPPKGMPCWSLAALLNILPNNKHITTSISKGSWQIDPIKYLPNTWWCEYEDSESLTEFNISADNPIDACVSMILKLHKQNLL